jgi:hypothetical protein
MVAGRGDARQEAAGRFAAEAGRATAEQEAGLGEQAATRGD